MNDNKDVKLIKFGKKHIKFDKKKRKKIKNLIYILQSLNCIFVSDWFYFKKKARYLEEELIIRSIYKKRKLFRKTIKVINEKKKNSIK
jgi:hypothetical protein